MRASVWTQAMLIGGITVTTMTSAQDLQGKVVGFADLFEPGARVEKVATGFRFTEGPVWDRIGKLLLFSDIPANQIRKWESGDTTTVFREPSGNSNGLTYDKQGRLIACEHGNRRVSRTEPDGRITVLADRFEGKRLNSPNDVVVKSGGSVYFTDPPYGVGPESRELDFQGVYRIKPEGGLDLLVKDFAMPNGLAFSPDEKRLYIGDSSQHRHIRVFDVKPDGTLENGRVFADLSDPKPGAPDGMKVDTEGRLFSTGPGGVWVFAPDGTHLGTIATPEGPANCAWGESGWRTLFITAGTSVYRIRLKAAGVPVP